MTSLKWIIHKKRKNKKRGKKIHKTVKNYFYFKEKESLAATSEQQKTLQDLKYN